jgi:hypothetical protein
MDWSLAEQGERMSYAETLIDKAAKECGGVKKLCEQMGFTTQYLHDVRKGKTPLSVVLAGRLAVVARVDVQRAMEKAALELAKRSEYWPTLLAAMERGFLVLVAAIFCFFATETDAHGTTQSQPAISKAVDVLSIVSSWCRALFVRARSRLRRVQRQVTRMRLPPARPVSHHQGLRPRYPRA